MNDIEALLKFCGKSRWTPGIPGVACGWAYFYGRHAAVRIRFIGCDDPPSIMPRHVARILREHFRPLEKSELKFLETPPLIVPAVESIVKKLPGLRFVDSGAGVLSHFIFEFGQGVASKKLT